VRHFITLQCCLINCLILYAYFKVNCHPFINLSPHMSFQVKTIRRIRKVLRIPSIANIPKMTCWTKALLSGKSTSSQVNAPTLSIAVQICITFVLYIKHKVIAKICSTIILHYFYLILTSVSPIFCA
jgi:hypothetical protein